MRDVPKLMIGDCIPEAVDFHCEPAILKLEPARQHAASIEDVKAAIRQNASCLNFRRFTRPTSESKAMWNTIKTDVKGWQNRRVRAFFDLGAREGKIFVFKPRKQLCRVPHDYGVRKIAHKGI